MARSYAPPPSSPYNAYVEESRTPFAALVFTLPIFIAYHVGAWGLRHFQDVPWANAADVFLARAMQTLGVSSPFVSLAPVVVTLLALQVAAGSPWRFRASTFFLMALESLLLALPPFLLGKLVNYILLASGEAGFSWPEKIVLSLGAGVYEEFLFRLLLMGVLFWIFRRVFGWDGGRLYVAAVLTQAVLFALFHHLPGSPEPLALSRDCVRALAFRTISGVYFAYVYRERGFGVAAGSHALYDVIAVSLDAFR